MENEKKHLPLIGVGPWIVTPQLILTVITVILSELNILPIYRLESLRALLLIIGMLVICIGIWLWYSSNFRTKIDQCIEKNQLATTGAYAYVRNPIYSAFFLVCCGIICMEGNLFLIFVPVVCWVYMSIFLKQSEEKWLSQLYGKEYEEYRKHVNRCIPWFNKRATKMTEKEYKQLTLAEFESAAEKFDDNDPSVYNMCRRDYPEVLEEVKKEDFTDLLDAGCGTGAMLGLFCKDIKGKNYTGIDLSNKMIEVAHRRNLSNAVFTVGDCEALPFEDESFDVVTCSMSFHHYPNPDKFFLNLSRVLRPGGRFILRDMASNSAFLMWLFNRVEIPVINKLCNKGDVHCYTRKDMELLCKSSGLLLESYEVRKGFRLHCVVRKA